MISHPEGRQILRDRPMVSSQTVDLDKLKGMRRGTLGREYVEWLVRGNVTPDTRETVSRAIGGKLTTRYAISTRLVWPIL
jgi:ubiquinone biosynthesis protein COQ4